MSCFCKVVFLRAGASLYTVDNVNQEIYKNPKNVQDPRHKVNWKVGDGRTVASFVAKHKEYVMVDDILGDERFPDGVGHQGDEKIKIIISVSTFYCIRSINKVCNVCAGCDTNTGMFGHHRTVS